MMTLANLITALRLVCIPFLLMLFFNGPVWGFYVLLALVLLSDLVDGALARAQRQITTLGKILDPLVDKALFFSLFLALTIRGDLCGTALILFAVPPSVLILGALWLRWKRSRWVIIEARLLGKASSTLISLGIIGLVAPLVELVADIAHYVLYGGIALSYAAMGEYIFIALHQAGKLRRERGY